MKKPLIILTGQTAVGKTKLSISLAKAVNGAIISADSMQVYRHMDIGSAKTAPEEMCGVPHYLIDVLDPSEEFHVVKFVELAHEAMEKIYAAGQIPIVTGGTGFYIQALLKEVDFTESHGELPIRKQLEEKAATEEGAAELYRELSEVDPASAETIHPNNVKQCNPGAGILSRDRTEDFGAQRGAEAEGISVLFCLFCAERRTFDSV